MNNVKLVLLIHTLTGTILTITNFCCCETTSAQNVGVKPNENNCVCMCVCMYVCTYIYIYIYMYVHTHTHTHTPIYIYIEKIHKLITYKPVTCNFSCKTLLRVLNSQKSDETSKVLISSAHSIVS